MLLNSILAKEYFSLLVNDSGNQHFNFLFPIWCMWLILAYVIIFLCVGFFFKNKMTTWPTHKQFSHHIRIHSHEYHLSNKSKDTLFTKKKKKKKMWFQRRIRPKIPILGSWHLTTPSFEKSWLQAWSVGKCLTGYSTCLNASHSTFLADWSLK